jgi:lysophospholipase L1-like esterase
VVNDNMTIRDRILVDHIIPAIYKVVTELNVSIIDLHSPMFGMPQLIPDGVHPNDLGYVVIAKTVYDRIK